MKYHVTVTETRTYKVTYAISAPTSDDAVWMVERNSGGIQVGDEVEETVDREATECEAKE